MVASPQGDQILLTSAATEGVLAAWSALPLIQPVRDVPAYLATRQPVADCQAETALLITLPARVRAETKCLCQACLLVQQRVAEGSKVQPACLSVLSIFTEWSWHLKTFRPKYDLWVRAKDWVILVNRSKAGKAWIDRDDGLSNVFLEFVAGRCGEYKRNDAGAEAIRSIQRQWKTGVNHRGQAEVIPGVLAASQRWEERNAAHLPNGWTVGNIQRQLKARAKWLKVHRALLHEGLAAARSFVPQVNSTRAGLRFMEEVQFDDVKCDFRVFDTSTGKPVDLWLLVAHDRATAMLLGFGLRPATVREDGSQEHLTLRDMKQLFGWLLERYGLPPYPMTAKVENGTATFTDGTAAALMEMLPGRLQISFAQMIGGKGAGGYLERALGNSKGKASLESHNRIGHIIASGLPGQTGPVYGLRPKELAAREKECVTLWNAAQEFPAGLCERLVAEFGYPLLTLQQARKELSRIFNLRNTRTDHTLEGFDKILVQEGGRIIKRMEMPAERAKKLCAGLTFDRVSPEIIAAFYEHTERVRPVEQNGEIQFHHEGKLISFVNAGSAAILPGTKVLCYYHPDDPRYLHLTSGKGEVLGTWLRKALVKNGDRVALSEAIHHSAAALKTAKAYAEQINAGETTRLTAMRERNHQLIQTNTFVDVTPSAAQGGRMVSSPVAAAMAGTRRVQAEMSENPPPIMATPDCTEELLQRASVTLDPNAATEQWD